MYLFSRIRAALSQRPNHWRQWGLPLTGLNHVWWKWYEPTKYLNPSRHKTCHSVLARCTYFRSFYIVLILNTTLIIFPSSILPKKQRTIINDREHVNWIITLCPLHAQKGISRLIIVGSETNHFRNTFLKSETIEMIPESIVLVCWKVKTASHSQEKYYHWGFLHNNNKRVHFVMSFDWCY